MKTAEYEIFHVERDGQVIDFNGIKMTPTIALLMARQLILHVEHSILEKAQECDGVKRVYIAAETELKSP